MASMPARSFFELAMDSSRCNSGCSSTSSSPLEASLRGGVGHLAAVACRRVPSRAVAACRLEARACAHGVDLFDAVELRELLGALLAPLLAPEQEEMRGDEGS